MVWKTFKLALQEVIVLKVTITNDGTCPELEELVAPEMRLKEHGGTQDHPASWWPPTVPA